MNKHTNRDNDPHNKRIQVSVDLNVAVGGKRMFVTSRVASNVFASVCEVAVMVTGSTCPPMALAGITTCAMRQ